MALIIRPGGDIRTVNFLPRRIFLYRAGKRGGMESAVTSRSAAVNKDRIQPAVRITHFFQFLRAAPSAVPFLVRYIKAAPPASRFPQYTRVADPLRHPVAEYQIHPQNTAHTAERKAAAR